MSYDHDAVERPPCHLCRKPSEQWNRWHQRCEDHPWPHVARDCGERACEGFQIDRISVPCASCGRESAVKPVWGSADRPFCSDACRVKAEDPAVTLRAALTAAEAENSRLAALLDTFDHAAKVEAVRAHLETNFDGWLSPADAETLHAILAEAREALEAIARVGYGLDLTDTDAERAAYWARIAEGQRTAARAPLARLTPQAPTPESER